MAAEYDARVLDLTTREVVSRRIRADDEASARSLLLAQGLSVLGLSTVAAAGPDLQLRRQDLALFCRELRGLLQAGLSVVEALDALAAAAGGSSIYRLLLSRLQEGRALSTAMQELALFPPLLVASVRASERTSDLSHALDAYLRFDTMVGGLKRKVISASLYPALVVGLGGAIAVFLLLVVIPRFASLYADSGSQISVATRALLGFSALLAGQPWLAPAGIILLGVGTAWLASANRLVRLGEALVRAWPWLARQMTHFDLARLFEALALLVHGGYSLHEALGVCLTLMQSPQAHGRLLMARLRIEQGASASASFRDAGLTDEISERLIRAGERGGDFDRVLQAIAERHREAFETFVERATRIVEPVLLLGVAMMVGGMVVLLYMPVFDIAASVR